MSIQLPNPETDYFWNLVLKDGRTIQIPPQHVATIQRRISKREPINTTDETILYANIDSFDKTSRRFTDMKLLVETAQAFNEPIITEDGAVKARWVKKHVTRKEYDQKYAKSITYRMLGETEGMVAVALVIPLHKIDPQVHMVMTPEEVRKMGD